MLPILWAKFAPVFAVTASALVKLQAITSIPWLTFIAGSGVLVRVMLLPMMIRQMSLINQMSSASPNIRLAYQLFKHSKLSLPVKTWHFLKACVNY